MKNSLQISMLQMDLAWENKEINFLKTKNLLTHCKGSNLILLPEMFNTGFTMLAEKYAEDMNGSSISFLMEQAKKHATALATSLIIKENGRFYNRFVFVRPNGLLEYYDKRHLFTLAGEHHHYTSGSRNNIFEYEGWRIMPQICYDLRFPVWSRNVNNYDLLIYVANWPERRALAWISLLPARAIENLAYVAAVNRCGSDGNGIEYSGDSAIYDSLGNTMGMAISSKEQVVTAVLSHQELKKTREKFKFLEDRDDFELK